MNIYFKNNYKLNLKKVTLLNEWLQIKFTIGLTVAQLLEKINLYYFQKKSKVMNKTFQTDIFLERYYVIMAL